MHRLLAALRPASLSGRPVPSSPHSARTGLRSGVPRQRDGEPGSAADTASDFAADAAPPEPVGACGWFDSSHALQHGLCVTEHSCADAVAAELPLADWLQLHLCGWQAPAVVETPRVTGQAAH